MANREGAEALLMLAETAGGEGGDSDSE